MSEHDHTDDDELYPADYEGDDVVGSCDNCGSNIYRATKKTCVIIA